MRVGCRCGVRIRVAAVRPWLPCCAGRCCAALGLRTHHACDALHQLLVVVSEGVDGGVAEPLVAHLLLEEGELVACHGSCRLVYDWGPRERRSHC